MFHQLLRTLEVNLPWLLELKFKLFRVIRNKLSIPFEQDFRGLSHLPVPDGALFLDVGANRGQSTDAILMQHKNIKIQLFEPNNLLCNALNNLFANKNNLVICNFGLSDQASETTLYVPFYKKWMFDGLASLEREEAANWLKDRLYFYKEKYLTVLEVACKVRTLDELDLSPFFIKIDVQGHEYSALKGSENTLKKHTPVLLIEAPDEKITGYLASLGYQFYAYEDGHFKPSVMGGLNTFFMTADKWALVSNSK